MPSSFSRTATDSAPASEAPVRALGDNRSISDSAPASDPAALPIGRFRNASDSAPASDVVARAPESIARTATDHAVATDAASAWVYKPTPPTPPPITPPSPIPPTAPTVPPRPAPPVVPVYGFNIYEDDVVTLVGSANTPVAAKWLDGYRDVGSGSIELKYGDAARPLLTEGRVVKPTVNGREVFAFVIDSIEEVLVSPQEFAGMHKAAMGRGIASLMDTGFVFPTLGFLPNGTTRYPLSDDRTFNFGSLGLLDVSGWANATILSPHQSDDSELWTGTPAAWPGPDVAWIGPSSGNQIGAPIGHNFLVKEYTFSADHILVLFLAADNRMSVYIDGIKIAELGSQTGTTEGFRTTKVVTVYISAGTHRFGFDLRNVAFDGSEPIGFGMGENLAGNPTGMLALCYRSSPDGQLISRIFQSDDTFKILEYPMYEPGPTAGQIVNTLLDDNQTKGLLGWTTRGFTSTQDKLGNAWPPITFTAKVGADLEVTLNAMQDAQMLEWCVTPVGELQLYKYGTRGTSKGVAYTPRNNLLELKSTSRAKIADLVGVRWQTGQFIRTVAEGGTRGTWVSLPSASQNEAVAIADAILDLNGQVRSQLTAAIKLTGADVPFEDYEVADIVSVNGAAERATQIAGEVTDIKGLTLTPTFRDVLEEYDERLARTIKQFANGSIAGQARAAAPALPPPPFGSAQNPRDLVIQLLDPPLTGQSPYKRPTSNLNLYGLMVESTTAAGSDTTFEFLVNDLDVLGGAGLYPEGTTKMIFQNALGAIYWCIAGQTTLAINVEELGYLVSGLMFTPLFV